MEGRTQDRGQDAGSNVLALSSLFLFHFSFHSIQTYFSCIGDKKGLTEICTKFEFKGYPWCYVTNSLIDVVALHQLSQILLVKHNPPKL